MDFHKWLGKGSLSLGCVSFGPLSFFIPPPPPIILITEHSKSFINRWHTNSCSKDTASIHSDSVMTTFSNLDIAPFSFFPISCTYYVHLIFCFSFLKKMIFLQDGSLLMVKVFVLCMFSCKYKVATIFSS